MVAAPAAIVARWLGSGRLETAGVHPPELVIRPEPFYEELAVRGIRTSLTEEVVLARCLTPRPGTGRSCLGPTP